MVFTDGPVAPGNAGYKNFSTIESFNASVDKHLDVFKEQVEELVKNHNPLKINCHAGTKFDHNFIARNFLLFEVMNNI
jgi:hypothetical protein